MATQENKTNATPNAERIADHAAMMLRQNEAEIARLGLIITHLVDSIVRDANDLKTGVQLVGPEKVSVSWIDSHVRALMNARAEIESTRGTHQLLTRLVTE